jgi:hypothetical protein
VGCNASVPRTAAVGSVTNQSSHAAAGPNFSAQTFLSNTAALFDGMEKEISLITSSASIDIWQLLRLLICGRIDCPNVAEMLWI